VVAGWRLTTTRRAGSVHFSSFKEAQKSGLAKQLFKIEGVVGVFFGADFITVNKDANVAWHVLKPHIFGEITDYYASGAPARAQHRRPSEASVTARARAPQANRC
jgi:hypothetical protein